MIFPFIKSSLKTCVHVYRVTTVCPHTNYVWIYRKVRSQGQVSVLSFNKCWEHCSRELPNTCWTCYLFCPHLKKQHPILKLYDIMELKDYTGDKSQNRERSSHNINSLVGIPCRFLLTTKLYVHIIVIREINTLPL